MANGKLFTIPRAYMIAFLIHRLDYFALRPDTMYRMAKNGGCTCPKSNLHFGHLLTNMMKTISPFISKTNQLKSVYPNALT